MELQLHLRRQGQAAARSSRTRRRRRQRCSGLVENGGRGRKSWIQQKIQFAQPPDLIPQPNCGQSVSGLRGVLRFALSQVRACAVRTGEHRRSLKEWGLVAPDPREEDEDAEVNERITDMEDEDFIPPPGLQPNLCRRPASTLSRQKTTPAHKQSYTHPRTRA